MTTPMLVPETENAYVSAKAKPRKWIYLAASLSSLGAGLLLLAGLIGLDGANNWLITIFRLHAGSKGTQLGQLYRLNTPDLVLLALVATAYVGLCVALRRNHPILAAIAAVQPPLGMLLFLLTHSVGRSAVMGAGFVISLAMLRGGPSSKYLGWIGLLSSALLLAGDLGTDLAPCTPLAVATALGYVLLIGWLLAISRQLQQLAR